MAEKYSFPMISEKCWWAIREQFKKTIPATISVNYLKSLLSLTSDQAAKNILYPLRQMNIIDDDNKTTDLAAQWRSDSQYAGLCQKFVAAIYPKELTDLFPDSSIDTKKAKDWFMNTAKIGDSAAGKMIATFSLLKKGQVKDGSTKADKKSSRRPSVKRNVIKKEKVSVNTQREKGNGAGLASLSTDKMMHSSVNPALHIDLQIHISPEASSDQIDIIFASIAKHLYDK